MSGKTLFAALSALYMAVASAAEVPCARWSEPGTVMEVAGLGPCGSYTCLYLADIGDNAVRRQSVQIAIIRETERFAAEVAPERVITARYPDGPHDAEAIAIHPAGDLLLATKTRPGQEGPSLLFRLSAAQLAAGGEQTFAALGAIPVATLTDLGPARGRVVTAIAPNRYAARRRR